MPCTIKQLEYAKAYREKLKQEGRKPLRSQESIEKRKAYSLQYWANMSLEEKSAKIKKVNDKRKHKTLKGSEFYERNKENFAVKRRNRRAEIKGNGGTHTKNDITSIWFLQKGKCTWCLQRLELESAHVDHRVPIKLGGSNDKTNLQLLHAHCNKSKAAKHPTEYGLKYGLLAW